MSDQDDGGSLIDFYPYRRRFKTYERLEPAVRAVLTAAGFTEMPPSPPVQEFKLVDVRVGA